jgi:hypothetical protein
MHLGYSNPHRKYCINNTEIKEVSSQKDLGVTFCDNLKFGKHCTEISHKAHIRANLILKCFTASPAKVLVRAFSVFVRPILEYGSEVWNPYLKKDVLKLESVQRRFTKRLAGMHQLSYEERLEVLELETLEERRIKNDLRTCYKLIMGLTHPGPDPSFLELRESRSLRGHPVKIVWETAKKNCRHYFFLARVGRIWNALPQDLVLAPSLAAFKAKLRTLPLRNYAVLQVLA